ncbi:MAG: DNA repair protein RecO [Bacillota bacterium]|nr:DNA repair protein RecO [Bacillota bacterium]
MRERLFKADGLVLKTRILGEADRLITILTEQEGKLEALAKGARKIKSRLAAGVDLFTYGHYTFHQGKTWPIITGQEAIERFLWFRNDPDLYPYGLYLAELTDRLLSGEESCPDIFHLLFDAWTALGEDVDRDLICRAFELKLFYFSGYNPNLQCCQNCGVEKTSSFSPRQGGMLCSLCCGVDAISIEPGTLALAKRLIESSLSQVKLIRPSVRQQEELNRITTSFINYHLDLGEIKSRRLLQDMLKSER